jgi:excisionase family DNA binding protein
MAGMFYSLQEAAEKLNLSEEQISELVEQGKLREFRDGANLLFKVDEVEALVGETSEVAAQPSAGDQEQIQEEISLEPVEDTSALEPVSAGEDMAAAEDTAVVEPLAAEEEAPAAGDTAVEEPISSEEEVPLMAEETEPEKAEPPSAESSGDELTLSDEAEESARLGELTNADTAITREGINVLEGTGTGYDIADDTMSETQAMQAAESLEEIEEDVNLDTFGSGSGLLDLSLQADDTSLGGILDEIYTPDEQQQGEVAAGESASAEEVAAEADILTADEDLVAPQPAAVVRGYVEPEPDSSSNLFGMMLFLPLLVVIYTAIVTAAGLFRVMPTVLEQTRGFILYALGGLIVVALMLMAMGFMAAKPTTGAEPKAKKEKPPKVKKERPPKPKKEKRPKKEKKPKKKK